MKRLITTSVLAGLFAGIAAFGADQNNKFSIPQVQTNSSSRLTPRVRDYHTNFARIAHQDLTEACIGEVAAACDGSLSRSITRKAFIDAQAAAARQGRSVQIKDVATAGELRQALSNFGVNRCGLFSSANGKSEMEVLVKDTPVTRATPNGNAKLIAFRISKNDKCAKSAIPVGEALLDFKVGAERAYGIGRSGKIYYLTAGFELRSLKGVQATQARITVDARNGAIQIPTTQGPFTVQPGQSIPDSISEPAGGTHQTDVFGKDTDASVEILANQ